MRTNTRTLHISHFKPLYIKLGILYHFGYKVANFGDNVAISGIVN